MFWGGAYVSPYLLEILSTRPGAPTWTSATGSLVANTGQTVSCSRASSAYCLGDDGLLHLLSANQPRVEPSGLLVEGASTNTIKNSTAIGTGATWGLTALTATANAATAPDGTNTAALLQTVAGNANHRCYDDGSDANGNTRSVYVKAPAANACRYLTIGDSDLLTAWGSIDLQTGTYVPGSGDSNGTVTAMANGWYRLSFYGNTNTFYTLWPGETAVATNPYNATGGKGVLVWMAQSEAVPFPTSPIVTGAASATRAADLITITNPLGAADTPITKSFRAITEATNWSDLNPIAGSYMMATMGYGGSPNEWALTASAGTGIVEADIDQTSGYAAWVGSVGLGSGSTPHVWRTVKTGTDLTVGTIDGATVGSASGTGATFSAALTPVSIGSNGANNNPFFGWMTDIVIDNK